MVMQMKNKNIEILDLRVYYQQNDRSFSLTAVSIKFSEVE